MKKQVRKKVHEFITSWSISSKNIVRDGKPFQQENLHFEAVKVIEMLIYNEVA